MSTVEPIKLVKKIKAMLTYLKGKDSTGRNAMIFHLGINSAYRISDLLNLKYEDVFSDNYRFREYIRTTEQKTMKYKQFKPPEQVRNNLKTYAQKNKIKPGDWLFPSFRNRSTHLDRTNAWRFLSNAAQILGIKHFGTHSMRKTFGYHYYQKTKDIGTLMKVFNHSSQNITLRYIGIDQENIDKVYTEVEEIYDL
jgi:integrase